MAVLATGAAVLGGAAGVGVPALAGESTSTDPSCLDPARTTQTVTTPGGLTIDCEAPDTSPATTTTMAETTATTPDPPAATPADAAPAPAGPETATPKDELALAPVEVAKPKVKVKVKPGPSADDGDGDGDARREQAKAKARSKHRTAAKTRRKVKAHAKVKVRAELRADHRAKAAERTRVKAKLRVKAKSWETSASTNAASLYAALPPSWTSLAPITVPADGIDGFPIPPFLLPIFQAAGAQYGVPWEVLASINEIETDFGRNTAVSSAGAFGWMQFIHSSWERWGTDGDGDGRRDPRNPVDAIFAAARYLDNAGAGTDLPKAIFAYNHADWYVNRVVKRAREFAGLDQTLVSALAWRALKEDFRLYRAVGNPFAGDGAIRPKAGQTLLMSKQMLTQMVLESKDITIYSAGRLDIASGRVNRRVLAMLLYLASSGLKPTVSCLESGHSRLTTSGNISAHSYGHAVDISAINGISIAGHQGPGSITDTTLRRLTTLQGYVRPNQIISLMTIEGQSNTLSMGDHDDHIHVGFPRVPTVPASDRPVDIAELVAIFESR